MVLGVLSAALERGWSAEAVLSEETREHDWIEPFRAAGVDLRFAPPAARRSRRSRAAWLAQELDDGDQPTVFHTHFTAWDLAALSASQRERGDAVFWHTHSALPRTPLVIARSALKFGIGGRRIDGIFCPAPNICAAVRRRLGPRRKIHFLPSALRIADFPVLDEAGRAGARRQLGIDADTTVLLHFGWHFHLKGNDVFLRTLDEIRRRDPSLKMLGLSRGADERTAELAREIGVSDVFRLQQPVAEISTLFAAADAMVSSSREEGMAYAVLESLCSGTAVVATDIPGHAYLGEHIEACRMTGHDPADIAAGVIATIGRDREQAAAEGRQAHEWIAAELSVPKIAERVLGYYQAALA